MGISNAAKVDATILNPAVFQALQSTRTSSATPNCIQVSLQSQSMSHQIQSQQAKPELYKTANVASTATRTQSSLVMSSGNMADHYTHLFRLIWCSHGTPGRGRVPGKSLRGHHTSGQHLVHCNLLLQLHQMIQLDSIRFNWIQLDSICHSILCGIHWYSIVFNDFSQIVLHVHVLLVGLPSHVIRSSALEMLP